MPSLVDGKLKGVTAGEMFWFITKGDEDNGMPSWAFLPEQPMADCDVRGSNGLGQDSAAGSRLPRRKGLAQN